jgi:hypothetical protein
MQQSSKTEQDGSPLFEEVKEGNAVVIDNKIMFPSPDSTAISNVIYEISTTFGFESREVPIIGDLIQMTSKTVFEVLPDSTNFPKISIYKDQAQASSLVGSVIYNSEEDTIYLAAFRLHSWAQFVLENNSDQAAIITNVFTDEVTFNGTAADFYKLAVVEELDHRQYRRDHPETPEGKAMVSVAFYDSSDIEFHALQAQLSYAKGNIMDSTTIECLEARVLRATAVRVANDSSE